MKNDILKRVVDEARYIIKTEETIRNIAKIYNISKSTVHKDLNERLIEVDKGLYEKVSYILRKHIDVRHIRGGESTRLKYLKLNKKKENLETIKVSYT